MPNPLQPLAPIWTLYNYVFVGIHNHPPNILSMHLQSVYNMQPVTRCTASVHTDTSQIHVLVIHPHFLYKTCSFVM